MLDLLLSRTSLLSGLGIKLNGKVCGTCRFYNPCNLDGSGWCRNLERANQEDLVLVRAVELSCADGWGRDVWQPQDRPRRLTRTPLKQAEPAISRPESKKRANAKSADLPWEPLDEEAILTAPVPKGRKKDPAWDALMVGRAANGLKVIGTEDEIRHNRDAGKESSALAADSSRVEPVQVRVAHLSLQASMFELPSRHPGTVTPEQELQILKTKRQAKPADAESIVAEILARKGENTGLSRRGRRSPAIKSGVSGFVREAEAEEFVVADEGSSVVVPAIVAVASAPVPENPAHGERAIRTERVLTVPASETVAATTCQLCETCRHYRSTLLPGQGWCENRLAFKKPSLVRGDALSCQTSRSVWWEKRRPERYSVRKSVVAQARAEASSGALGGIHQMGRAF